MYGWNWSFDSNNIVRLPGAHGEEIVRSMYIDNKAGTIFTAGEDGKVKAWRTAIAGNNEDRANSEKPRKKSKYEQGGGGYGKGRFKPY